MSVLLFSLRGVPDDEADEIRELLTEQGVDFYETPAGNWGVSMPALWLRDAAELASAQALLAAYQQQRTITQRALYVQNKSTTLWQAFTARPLLYVVYLLAMSLVLYASIRLPFELGL